MTEPEKNVYNEAEQDFLAVLLQPLYYPGRLEQADLDPRDLYYQHHRHVFLAIQRVTDQLKGTGDYLDRFLVSEELRRTAQLDEVGGDDYLKQLEQSVAHDQTFLSNMAIIKELAERRRLAESAKHILAMTQTETYETAEVLKTVQDLMDYAASSSWQRNGKVHDPSILSAEVTDQPVDWLWQHRIATGMLHLIAGEAGTGKSAATLDLAARLSTGKPWPTDVYSQHQARDVLLLSAEDDHARTIGPRLSVAGADRSRIHFMESVEVDGRKRAVSIIDHVEHIKAAIKAHDCALCVIDPVSAFLGTTTRDKVDSHSNTDVRDALMPLHALAAETRCAFLLVTHLNKTQGKAIHRVIGSVAFVALVRVAFVCVKDSENPSRRLWLPVKNNLAEDRTGYAYSLTGFPTPLGEIVKVEWESSIIDNDADEEVEQFKTGPKPDKIMAAVECLKEILAEGAKPKSYVLQLVPHDVSDRTLRRAREHLGVISTKTSGGVQTWELPSGSTVVTTEEGEVVPF